MFESWSWSPVLGGWKGRRSATRLGDGRKGAVMVDLLKATPTAKVLASFCCFAGHNFSKTIYSTKRKGLIITIIASLQIWHSCCFYGVKGCIEYRS